MTVNNAKAGMQSAISHLQEELKGIRSGRANPSMLDSVQVDAYGTAMQLKDLASVSVPEARQLLVTPFDGSNTAAIAKGIEKANLGMMPAVDGSVIRLNVPPMDEALRKKMATLVNKEREHTKVSIRNVRRDANEEARAQKASGDLAEDQLHKIEKQIQELTDEFCKKADALAADKEKEVMSV